MTNSMKPREDRGLKVEECDAYWVKIYIAGDINTAKHVISSFVDSNGLCVTVDPTTYVYSGGRQEGYVVGLINYARFPADKMDIWATAVSLATFLMDSTYQDSCSIMNPKSCMRLSRER